MNDRPNKRMIRTPRQRDRDDDTKTETRTTISSSTHIYFQTLNKGYKLGCGLCTFIEVNQA